ncbi:hypothetical protein [Embleya sp. AB8]|uniref:hypothetical protein n=1 Tax=Embleya sp. AB8 TaxID=3156304 RepID=UPI003C76EAA1
MTASPYTTEAHSFRVLGHPVRVRVREPLGEHPTAIRAPLSAGGVPSSCPSRRSAIVRRPGVVRSALHGSIVGYAPQGPGLPAPMRVADSAKATLPTGPPAGLDDPSRTRTHPLANAPPPIRRAPPRANRVTPS